MIKEVVIKAIPHKEQRYDTVGDWIFNSGNGRLTIWISKMNNWKYEQLVAVHEYNEALLCITRGVKEFEVTKFDLWYEGQRKVGAADCQYEPGDHKLAPYRKEHFFATSVERLLAAELNVDWEEYDAAVQAL